MRYVNLICSVVSLVIAVSAHMSAEPNAGAVAFNYGSALLNGLVYLGLTFQEDRP
jgi:hypothetical protein